MYIPSTVAILAQASLCSYTARFYSLYLCYDVINKHQSCKTNIYINAIDAAIGTHQ